LNILSGMPVTELARAIRSEDVGRLIHLQGVGKKTAERLCLELKEKIRLMPGLEAPSQPASNEAESGDERSQDAVSALVNLGYPVFRAKEALKEVRLRTSPEVYKIMKLEELLRQALRSMT
jgi:holliday junction DNA helicase RuvA